MNFFKPFALACASAALIFSSSQVFAGDYSDKYSKKAEYKEAKKTEYTKIKKDIVDTAASNEKFSTLVAAVKAAGLVDTLKSDGPFTVFAPTNAAFEALPEGTLDNLLKPEGRDQLVAILKYHVVPGKVAAKDVVKLSTAETALGRNVDIKIKNDEVMVNDAKVVMTDIKTSNGIIHVIDTVILPEDELASL